MAEEPENNDITLESVVEIAPEELSDDQKSFLQENADDLNDEQKETYKDVLSSEDDDEPQTPEVPDPEVRGAPEEDDDDDPKTPPAPSDDDDVDPEDRKAINKIVDQRMKGVDKVTAEIQAVKNIQEVDSFISAKSEYAPYRDAMIKYISHPAYTKIPVHNIAAIVSANDQQKMGAKKERDAAKKAKDTQSKGTQTREVSSGKKDWGKASPEEVAEQRAKVLGHQG